VSLSCVNCTELHRLSCDISDDILESIRIPGLVGHFGTMEGLPMGLLSLRVSSNSPSTLDSSAAYSIVVDYMAYELK